MKKILLTLTLVASFIATAQVKIGDRPTVIDGNSLLELETTNQGLLYPRVALTSTTSYAPLSDTLPNIKQPGMTVYNTATTTTGTNDVTPGLYVNDGFNWIRVTPTADKTLYTDNAAITSDRTVTLNNNNLTFTAGGSGTGIMGSDKLKIGANPTTIDANSLLELESTTKGLLYPRVELRSTTSYLPLIAINPVTLLDQKKAGMTVYNTATTTTGTNDVTPGLYVNDGFNWIRVTPTAPKTLYTDNAAITSARTVTLNNNDLTFTAGVGGTGKTVVASTFKTGGAVYGNVRTLDTSNSGASGFDLTNNTVLLSSDYILILSKPNAHSITMPNPGLDNTSGINNSGRILYLINNSTAAGAGNSYNFIGTYQPIPVTSIATVRTSVYVSNGSAWYKMSY